MLTAPVCTNVPRRFKFRRLYVTFSHLLFGKEFRKALGFSKEIPE